MEVKVERLTKSARLPKRHHPGDAAYDIYADEEKSIPKGEVQLVSTGIAIALPNDQMYARIAPRSGLAVKHGIDTFAGVIDSGYRGEVKVALFNAGREDYQVKKGDRIAQMIITPILTPDMVESEGEGIPRASGGFGSTGK